MNKVKVVDSWVLSFLDDPVTVIKLEKHAPYTEWRKMAVDGYPLEMVYMTGGHLDMWAVKGTHDLTGKEITFI